MLLTDTGPLVALLDVRDPHHERCREAGRRLPPTPFLTTWPCFTEAIYLLGAAGGYPFQAALWELRRRARLEIAELTAVEVDRAAELMKTYSDRPMDLADASLVALAESRRIGRLFTLDSDFRFYRLASGATLDLVP